MIDALEIELSAAKHSTVDDFTSFRIKYKNYYIKSLISAIFLIKLYKITFLIRRNDNVFFLVFPCRALSEFGNY